MKATIFDVAQEVGVSIATVSNALTGKKKVSEATRAKIDAAVQKLGYTADPAASSLKSCNSRIIGLIVPSIDNAFFPAVIRGLSSVLEPSGYIINFYSTGFHAEMEEKYIHTLLNLRADGIILDSVSRDERFLRSLASLKFGKKRVPVVALERDLTGLGMTSIYSDNHYGGKLAATHLAKRGAKHVAHVRGPETAPWSQDRYEGFRAGLREAGLSENPALVVDGDFTLQGGRLAAEQLLASGVPFDAVFAANDLMAIGVIKTLMAHGLRVPEDVLVVGFDNTYVAALTTPPVTTVDLPQHHLGEQAGHAIMKAIASGGVEQHCLPLSLIERRSSNPTLPEQHER